MTQVTRASIAYAATQVRIIIFFQFTIHSLRWAQARFALASAAVFSRSDTVTDSERFYNSVLELLDDVDQIEEANRLLAWWNR